MSDVPFEGPWVDGWMETSEVIYLLRAAGRDADAVPILQKLQRDAADETLALVYRLWEADALEDSGQVRRAADTSLGTAEAASGATFGEGIDVRAVALEVAGQQLRGLGDLEGATRRFLELAEHHADRPAEGGHAMHLAARTLADHGEVDEAAELFQRTIELGEAGDQPEGPPRAAVAREDLRELQTRDERSFATAHELVAAVGDVLTEGGGGSFDGLLGPTHASIGMAGGERELIDRGLLIEHLTADLRTSTPTVVGVEGQGGKRYVWTEGWEGEWFRGRVAFLLTRMRFGWRCTGIVVSGPTDALIERWTPEEPETNQPLPFDLLAPWPEDLCFKAGGFWQYIGRQSAIAAAAAVPFLGPLKAAIMTMGFAMSRCGFGPRGYYYNFGSHVGQEAFAIDFTRYRQGVPYWNVSDDSYAQPIASGAVTRVRRHNSTGSPTQDNRVEIRHRSGGREYSSRYLHLAGPNQTKVSVGQWARASWRLGPMDDTGWSVLDHLHLCVHDVTAGGGTVRPTPMDGHRLQDGDGGRCVCSTNETYTGWQISERVPI